MPCISRVWGEALTRDSSETSVFRHWVRLSLLGTAFLTGDSQGPAGQISVL